MINSRIIKFGNNIDTDQIIPAQYLRLETIIDMAPYTFLHDKNFTENFKEGFIIVGDENFGCGSSREQAPAVLRDRGVTAIIAKSFARIFYRNAINLGILLIKCSSTNEFSNLDEISIDLNKDAIVNLSTNRTYSFEPFPIFILNILKAGGIVAYKTRIVK